MDNILQMQYDKAFKKAKKIINNLKNKNEAIYIIDNEFNSRVFFKYKENAYFLSDSFPIYSNYNFDLDINLKDSSQLLNICANITNTFSHSYIGNSKLIKDIDSFIDEYMIDNLILKVDRIRQMLLEAVSLEYYNELLLINKESIFKILKIDNQLVKVDLSEYLLDFKLKDNEDDYLDKILNHLYTKCQDIFPYDSLNCIESELLDIRDIIYQNNSYRPLLLMVNISNNNMISYEIIAFDNMIDYLEIDIQETIEKLLLIDKNDDIVQNISYIMIKLYMIYENCISDILH